MESYIVVILLVVLFSSGIVLGVLIENNVAYNKFDKEIYWCDVLYNGTVILEHINDSVIYYCEESRGFPIKEYGDKGVFEDFYPYDGLDKLRNVTY